MYSKLNFKRSPIDCMNYLHIFGSMFSISYEMLNSVNCVAPINRILVARIQFLPSNFHSFHALWERSFISKPRTLRTLSNSFLVRLTRPGAQSGDRQGDGHAVIQQVFRLYPANKHSAHKIHCQDDDCHAYKIVLQLFRAVYFKPIGEINFPDEELKRFHGRDKQHSADQKVMYIFNHFKYDDPALLN